MPVDTKIDIPWNPQEGVTAAIIGAMHLADQEHFQRQQLALQQQQVSQQGQLIPSEIQKNTASAGQAQAETSAIPKRLDLQQKEVDATNELKKATIESETHYRMGMLGVAQDNAATKARTEASQTEFKKFQEYWGAKLDSAKIGGIAGNLQLRGEALSQQKQLTEEEIGLREQANAMRAKGLDLQADMLTQRADDAVNKIGIVRNLASGLGLAPKIEIPPQAGQPSRQAAPPKPKSSGPVTVRDPQGNPHVFPDQSSADSFKKEAGIP
jgi:hypothetical protein